MPSRPVTALAAAAAAGAPALPSGAPDRLPIERVFVVKLAAAGRRCRGQLEHVASGRRQSFGSARELIEVLRRGGEEGTP